MSKRRRAEIVELLRCAADMCNRYKSTDTPNGSPFWEAMQLVYSDHWVLTCFHPIWSANLARFDVRPAMFKNPKRQRLVYLEAACRVEEGSWP